MTIVAAWRGDGRNHIPPQGRRNGQTFIEGWARARRTGPRFVLAGTFNEWANPSEEPSAEVSKDLEPSRIFGRKYLDLLTTEAAAFKAGTDPDRADGVMSTVWPASTSRRRPHRYSQYGLVGSEARREGWSQ
jgi:hypothetical protein